MIPSKLRLSGFLSYQQFVEVDFGSFDLACISGSNGAGKSSLLDAVTWVIFGQARRTDEAVINNQCDQAEVGLDFFYEGELYRVQRSKVRGKPVVLEFYIHNPTDGWMPLTEATLRKTEEKIQDTLRMDYEVFTNAAFFLQGKADQFATQKASDRKRILGSILGLDQWEAYKEKAVTFRKRMEKEEIRIQAEIESREREIGEEDQRKSELARLESELKEKNAALEERERYLRTLRDRIKSIEGLQTLVSQQKSQVDSLQQDIAGTRASIDQRKQEIAAIQDALARTADIEKGYSDYRSAAGRVEELDQLADRYNQLQNKAHQVRLAIENKRASLKTRLESFETQARSVAQDSRDRQEVHSKMQAIQEQIDLIAEKMQKKSELQEETERLKEQQSNKMAENRQLRVEMDRLKEKISQLKAKDSSCPVCGKPWTEEDREHHAKELEGEGAAKGDQYRANEAVLKIVQDNLSQTQEKMSLLEQDEQASQALQRQLSAMAQRLSDLDTRIADWEQKGIVEYAQARDCLEGQDFERENQAALKEIETEMKALGYDEELHKALREQKRDLSVFDDQKRGLDAARAKNEPLSRELDSLQQQLQKEMSKLSEIEPEYQKSSQELEEGLKNLPDIGLEEARLQALGEERSRLQQVFGAAGQKVAVLKELKNQVEEYSGQLETTRREISRVRQLETAFGANGIPALLVEEAIPALEARANDLLDKLSSGNMSVRFDTQKELKSKDEKRETLDIIITDPAGTRAYEMFSGGEAFRVNFSIRLALSHLLTQRAGARLQTLVIDEGFGSQDSDGRQRLIEAINQVKSDFEKIIVITHLEEFKDAFPARIEVEKTPQGSSVKVMCA